MKRNRFSEEQIIGILKEHEARVSVSDLCRKHGVSDASIYKWKANCRVTVRYTSVRAEDAVLRERMKAMHTNGGALAIGVFMCC
jgi:transposase-like protein